jgi:flagellar assembly factor FliW
MSDPIKITSRVLGEVEFGEEQTIEMPAGMIGFPEYHRYILMPFADPDVPFLCWQCIDNIDLCFIVIDPAIICPDYEIALPAEEFENIKLTAAAEGAVYVVVTVPENPREMTANLMGPVVINHSARKAKQLVLTDPRYTTRHRVLQPEAHGHACANSETE